MTRRRIAVGVALGWLAAAPAAAQGFGLQTHSSCATARVGAGVAAPCGDGSAVFFNPAALALQPSVIGVGITGVHSSGSFSHDIDSIPRARQEGGTSWVPYGYVNYNVNERLSAAVGVFQPYRASEEWPPAAREGTGRRRAIAPFPGRFVSYQAELTNIYVQPTVSFAPNPNFSFGAGVDVIFAGFDQSRRLDLATTPLPGEPVAGRTLTFRNIGVRPGTDYGDAVLNTGGTGVSFHVGALARFADMISVGARYLHSAAIDLEGDVQFSPVLTDLVLPPGNELSAPGNTLGLPAGSAVALDPILAARFERRGPLDDQAVTTNIELPAQFVLGVALTPMPSLTLVGDYQWTGWGTFDDTYLDFEGGAVDTLLAFDYRNAAAVRVGAEYSSGGAFTFRGGFAYNGAAQPDAGVSPLLPDSDRKEYAGGLGWDFRAGMRLDLALLYVDQADRRGRLRDRDPGLTETDVAAFQTGVYSFSGRALSATFSYRFGAER